jgi:hypothetical protein
MEPLAASAATMRFSFLFFIDLVSLVGVPPGRAVREAAKSFVHIKARGRNRPVTLS